MTWSVRHAKELARMTMIDRVILLWIAGVDTVGMFLMWKMLQQRQKDTLKRKFNKIMKKVGVTV